MIGRMKLRNHLELSPNDLFSCATVQLTMFGDLNKKSQTNLSKPRFRSLFKHDNSAPSAALFACLLLPSLLSKDPDQGYPRCFNQWIGLRENLQENHGFYHQI